MFSLSGGLATQAASRLILRPLTHAEIADYMLPQESQASGGLTTVGLGQPAYLELEIDKTSTASAVTWSLDSKPANSMAALTDSPLGENIPIFAPADKLVYNLAARKMLVPDTNGQYTVSATLSETGTNETVSITITAATYVGAGTFGTTKATFPQCALCHQDKATEWLGTLHSSMLTRSIDGLTSSHYNSNCIECHTVGFDTAPAAKNGGFDDVANSLGWTFPTTLQPGNWDAMPNALKQLANIQCENCHGPGSEHYGRASYIAVNYNTGNCAQCHDEPPNHTKVKEWDLSLHAVTTRSPSGPGRESCVGCHTGTGFIDRMEGVPESDRRTDYMPINCATCHDPHSAENPHQLRSTAPVTLENGAVVSAGGNGRLCMNCHHAREDANTYASSFHSHFGPHHGPQTDMLAGTNAYDYGKSIPSSGHLFATQDACVTCHMQDTASTNAVHTLAGGHTFKVAYEGDAPDGPTNAVDVTGVCANCHGQVNMFDFARTDYDGNGIVEGVQTEVQGLMNKLALLLPPVGQPKTTVTPDATWTAPQLEAAYNYLFVMEDGSHGIHNTAYAVGILKASINNLTGDANNDGLPDAWQTQYFGAINNANASPNANPAGDGVPNWLKYSLGLDPTKPGVAVAGGVVWMNGKNLVNPPIDPGETNTVKIYTAAEVVFNSEAGKSYQIQAISSLSSGWENLGAPIQGTGDPISYVTPTRKNAQMFFRVTQAP
jgi:hypothetical protein